LLRGFSSDLRFRDIRSSKALELVLGFLLLDAFLQLRIPHLSLTAGSDLRE
jgi:hypothetical protein